MTAHTLPTQPHPLGVTIGQVYEDPRGKIGRTGKREHVFTVRAGRWVRGAGEEVRTFRYWTREEAETAREELVSNLTSALAH
jgi:hypothetical protein